MYLRLPTGSLAFDLLDGEVAGTTRERSKERKKGKQTGVGGGGRAWETVWIVCVCVCGFIFFSVCVVY